ncbi:MAG TPA: type II toxin-antitoxin system VapC family toxin [Geminicoccaceae bacterium]|nr:type II toxin-antitoxin system VapC family toxin [Geminicoccaceae bacterium]
MRLPLDTRVFVWWYTGDERLGRRAWEAVADPANEVPVSAVVVWEIAVKRALGRMRFDGAVERAVAGEGFLPLPVTPRHAEPVGTLPHHHGDPFDRLLLAHAQAESMTLITQDAQPRACEGVALLET